MEKDDIKEDIIKTAFCDNIAKNIKNGFFGSHINQDTLNEIMDSELNEQNNQRLQCLCDKLKNHGGKQQVLPVLGAGVSIPIGIPAWESLLNNMWYRQMRIDLEFKAKASGDKLLSWESQMLSQISQKELIPPHSDDLLEYAQYFCSVISKDKKCRALTTPEERELFINQQFIAHVKEGLIYPHEKIDAAEKWSPENLRKQRDSSLGLIGQITVKYGLNIITYNFDDLLEASLRANNESFPFNSIQDAAEMYQYWDMSTCKIYHVHGCIPLTDYSGAKESKKIIFAECDYQRAEQYSYAWLNAVQAERLHRKNLMIIGFSAQDYNFKRIIRNLPPLSQNEKAENEKMSVDSRAHFIFLPVEDFLKAIRLPKQADPTELNPTKASLKYTNWYYYIISMIQMFMKYKNEYLKAYGIYPIWTSHELLPVMLKTFL